MEILATPEFWVAVSFFIFLAGVLYLGVHKKLAAALDKRAELDRNRRTWAVKVWAPGDAGQIVLAKVDDASGRVLEAWTGLRSRGRWRAATRVPSVGRSTIP